MSEELPDCVTQLHAHAETVVRMADWLCDHPEIAALARSGTGLLAQVDIYPPDLEAYMRACDALTAAAPHDLTVVAVSGDEGEKYRKLDFGRLVQIIVWLPKSAGVAA